MNKKRFLAIAFLALSIAPVAAQYRVDRLITAGRSALYYEDYVLSIKYFNLAIGAKPYLYEPWYYRSVAKFSLDDYTGAESDATEALHLNPYINDIYDLRAICRIRQSKYDEAIQDYNSAIKIEPRLTYFVINIVKAKITSNMSAIRQSIAITIPPLVATPLPPFNLK